MYNLTDLLLKIDSLSQEWLDRVNYMILKGYTTCTQLPNHKFQYS